VSNGPGFPPGEFESFISRPRSGPTRTGDLRRAGPTHNYEPWDGGPARTRTIGPDRAAHTAGPYR
jgi:hypothetical protein